ncbi:MAG TPA: polysaccharide deacetylase family protein [Acidimicrobiales bacterium]|nr:polysaccharide deacetylase family protein [Acidimicrobiales bacterium]
MSRRTLIAVMAAVLAVIATVALVIARSGGNRSTPTTTTTSTSTSTTTTSTASTTTPSTTTTTTPGSTTTRRATTTTTAAVAPAIVVRRGNPNRMTVALTFDAGSDTGYAAQILDVLKANGIKATFGLTGKWTEANPGLVARMAAEGHLLVNHSYDHPSFTGGYGGPVLTQAQRLDQLARTEAAVHAASGATTKPWFRPPYGAEDASVRADVALGGYRYELMWTVDSWGWKGVPADEAVQRVVDGAVPGAIFLLHVGGASSDYSGLQRMIDGLRAKGYSFATAAGVIA